MPSDDLEYLVDVGAELTREEYLERDVWTLQYHFEELLKADETKAVEFLKWAMEAWSKTILNK